jgi:hypothetical protein
MHPSPQLFLPHFAFLRAPAIEPSEQHRHHACASSPAQFTDPPPKHATSELRRPPLHLPVPSERPLGDRSGRRPSSKELHGRPWWLVHQGLRPIGSTGLWTQSTIFSIQNISLFPGKSHCNCIEL